MSGDPGTSKTSPSFPSGIPGVAGIYKANFPNGALLLELSDKCWNSLTIEGSDSLWEACHHVNEEPLKPSY